MCVQVFQNISLKLCVYVCLFVFFLILLLGYHVKLKVCFGHY